MAKSSNNVIDSVIKEGIENTPLVFPEDKVNTTEFAFYTMLQLKKCYLTKAGGIRSNCPLGYPGLACLYLPIVINR